MENKHNTGLWVCLFAINQHDVEGELGSTPDTAPFNLALMKARKGVVMVVDEQDPVPVTRTWCLFETLRAWELKQPFRFATETFSITLGTAMRSTVSTGSCRPLLNAINDLSALDAKASVQADRFNVLHRVMNKQTKNQYNLPDAEAFARFMENPHFEFQSALIGHFSAFDNHVKELLATPMLASYLQNALPFEGSDEDITTALDSALLCIGSGASFTVGQLRCIERLRPGLLGSQDVAFKFCGADATASVVVFAAMRGLVPELRFLLNAQCDVDSRLNIPDPSGQKSIGASDSTALSRAAVAGHLSAATLLLDFRADANAWSKTSGWNPLHYALTNPVSDSGAIVTLLLANNAEMRSGLRGQDALHYAALFQLPNVCCLLLDQSADVNVSSDDGLRPLHCAAEFGKRSVIALLLSHRADVDAQIQRDHPIFHNAKAYRTAVEVARSAGHESVVDLLERGLLQL